jgi:intracellular multiplication protein IcmK
MISVSAITLALMSCGLSAYASDSTELATNQYTQNQKHINAAENQLTNTIQQSAFTQTKSQEFPLSTQQIKEVRVTNQNMQKATHAPLYSVKQDQRAVNLNISSPQIETVNLVPNYGTIVSFFDASGAPWTIKKVFINKSLGITDEIVGPKENQLVLSATNSYAQGNLIVTLMGLDNAISININANGKVSDRRVSFTLSELSPQSLAKATPSSNRTSNETLMLNLLAGTIPNNAEPMQIMGSIQGQAWQIGKNVYIRTQDQLISPAWNDQKSAAGVTVYQIPSGDTQFIFSANGLTEQVAIQPQNNQDGENN